MPLQKITAATPLWHPAFVDYVRAVFRRADFGRWIDWGQWGPEYHALAWIEGGQILANVSLTRMQLVAEGQSVPAWQLGAVGVRPPARGRGLARRLLTAALDEVAGAPVLLYGNPSVRAFYPRFGFSARPSWRFRLGGDWRPQGVPAVQRHVDDAAVRQALPSRCRTPADSRRLAACGHAAIVSWYYANGFAKPLWELEGGGWVSAARDGDRLLIDGVFAAEPVDLLAALPSLLDAPVRELEFGFYPDACLAPAVLARLLAIEEVDADLFLRDAARWPAVAAGLSPLART